MKSIVTYLGIICLVFFSFKSFHETNKTTFSHEPLIIGEWDNFQQYWQENTAEKIHGIETDDKHKHLSLIVKKIENGGLSMEIREGRNGKNFIEKINLSKNQTESDDFVLKGDTLFIKGENHFKNKDPYKFIRARKFSGWIEIPMESEPDGKYHQGNLEISDQGGMAELDVDGVDYTVELTQLIYGKKLAIMKLAVYNMPLDSVGINSRSISYTWVNPEAKRIGINLRKIISGWTFIEPGFVNQNTWRKKKE
ncbi:hypothetical protein [uncultured Maribacter sp.]|uniref:hypothetical protein n=1 Tax=uncultured Maribacter sp. TaxID=431308 RepID=UPI0026110471|nr:hypothetical protein [uncultured Maribacter sp.]